LTDRDKWRPKHNRSSIEISADILRLLRLGNTGKIQITYNAHLNRKQASIYINSLLEADLLEGAEEEMGLPSYRITRKGLAALSVIENIKEMLPPEGNTDILRKSKIVEVNLGHVFVTKGVANLARDNQQFALFVQNSLDRYRKGDWGNMSDEGRRLNNRFLERSIRTFSSYGSERFPEIWITTDPDRSCSTIMFPDEEDSIEPLEHYRSSEGIAYPEAKGASE
jgi:predicted transcriptional regulator